MQLYTSIILKYCLHHIFYLSAICFWVDASIFTEHVWLSTYFYFLVTYDRYSQQGYIHVDTGRECKYRRNLLQRSLSHLFISLTCVCLLNLLNTVLLSISPFDDRLLLWMTSIITQSPITLTPIMTSPNLIVN